jgi:hypothetical protein
MMMMNVCPVVRVAEPKKDEKDYSIVLYNTEYCGQSNALAVSSLWCNVGAACLLPAP